MNASDERMNKRANRYGSMAQALRVAAMKLTRYSYRAAQLRGLAVEEIAFGAMSHDHYVLAYRARANRMVAVAGAYLEMIAE